MLSDQLMTDKLYMYLPVYQTDKQYLVDFFLDLPSVIASLARLCGFLKR